jgi:RNA polymerase sigma-70 factor (ECF subfamily)
MPGDAEDMTTLDDGALARLVMESSATAEAELFARFSRRVRLYGLKHLRDADEADDLVQDVMSTVLTKLRAAEVREPDHIASFVLGTARQVCRGQERTKKRRVAILKQYAEPDAAADAPTGLGTLRERLAGCLAALADKQRAVLVLSFYAERTAAEIAEELGTSAGNVRVMRHRGIDQLSRCVQGDDVGGHA